ncbi:MAG: insulinase family protein [Ignavibacteriaceae bacterium]|nr:insulinase family protein [Ignavibacteriaceae bacterium]
MKKNLLGLFLILFAVVNLMADDKKVFPYNYTTEKLDNGLKVILIPMDSPGLVAYYSIVRTGSRDEWEPGKSGFAHFFEHMMFRGTERFPGAVYDSLVTSIGADANAYTSNDLTVYHINFASEDLDKVMDIESDRFQNLSYDEREFQTESGAVYGEYRKGRTSPFSVAIEKMQDMAYDVHTYKHTTIGFESDIKNMPNQYDYSKSFYQRYYRPENVVLMIVGDIDPAKTMSMVKKYYSSWKPGYVSPKIEQEPAQNEAHSAEVSYEGRTLPLLIEGYKCDAFDVSNTNYLASIFLADLAFGETSDLYKKLFLNEQKVEMIAANAGMSRDPGLFYIYSMVKTPDDIDYVRQEIFKTLDFFKTNKVDEKKLNDLKSNMKYSFLMGLETPDDVAGGLARFIALTGDITVVDSFYNNLMKITPEDVMNAAKLYFEENHRNEIVLKGAK